MFFLYCNVRPKMFSCRVLHVGRLSVLMDSDENNLKTISKFKFACFPAEFNSHRGKLFTLCSNILSCSNTIAKLNPFLKMLFRFFSIWPQSLLIFSNPKSRHFWLQKLKLRCFVANVANLNIRIFKSASDIRGQSASRAVLCDAILLNAVSYKYNTIHIQYHTNTIQ